MIVKEFEINKKTLACLKPLPVNGKLVKERHIAQLTLRGDDFEYHSEVSPLLGLNVETLEQAINQITKVLEQLIPFSIDQLDLKTQLFGITSDEELFPSVLFAIESALLNSIAPKKLQSISINELLSINELHHFKNLTGLFKIKINGENYEEEAKALLNFINENPNAFIRLDGNQSFDLESYKQFCKIIPKQQIEYFEEPLKEIKLHDQVNEIIAHNYALDENLNIIDLKDYPKLTKAVIIKPQKFGVSKTLQLIDYAYKNYLTPIISSSFEGSLGMRTLSQLINLPEYSYLLRLKHGLGTYRYLKEPSPKVKIIYDRDTLIIN